jgi:DNA invertase Pin-like site-specific DNA recombinase
MPVYRKEEMRMRPGLVVINALEELERSLIQERTKAGKAAAKARGVKMGRKPLLSPEQVTHARTLRVQEESPAQIVQLLNVSRRTLYKALAT